MERWGGWDKGYFRSQCVFFKGGRRAGVDAMVVAEGVGGDD